MKAYLVLDLSVNDFGGFRKYIAEIPAFMAKHSWQNIQGNTFREIHRSRGSANASRRRLGTQARMVIIEFLEREKADAFLGDPDIQDLFKVRHATTTSKPVLADGCT